jgi:hypothetical protein
MREARGVAKTQSQLPFGRNPFTRYIRRRTGSFAWHITLENLLFEAGDNPRP